MSDFIEEENGWLLIKDQDGMMIIKDARCITYPGTNGDSWWDLAQLLKQINKAISIFEEVHPGCCALFIFDQSSAHTSLGPEALCAFDMNKSNGRKCYVWTSLHMQIHWTASFLFFLLTSSHRSPCTIRSRVFSMYDTISCLFYVQYDLTSRSCTIRSLGSFMYNINL